VHGERDRRAVRESVPGVAGPVARRRLGVVDHLSGDTALDERELRRGYALEVERPRQPSGVARILDQRDGLAGYPLAEFPAHEGAPFLDRESRELHAEELHDVGHRVRLEDNLVGPGLKVARRLRPLRRRDGLTRHGLHVHRADVGVHPIGVTGPGVPHDNGLGFRSGAGVVGRGPV